MVVKIPALPQHIWHQHHPILCWGGTSLLEDGDDFYVDDSFLFSAMTVLWVLMEPVDYIVEVSGGVIDGNNMHFARVESSPSNQAHNRGKSVHSDLHHHISEARLALHEKNQLSLEWGVSERHFNYFLMKTHKIYFLSLFCMFIFF